MTDSGSSHKSSSLSKMANEDKNEYFFTASGYSPTKQEAYNLYLRKLHEHFVQIWNSNSAKVSSPEEFLKIKILGTGAFGIVYLVRKQDTGKYYAMKMLEKEKIFRLKQIEHSLYEKKILSGLNFPFVVYLKYFFKDNVYLYYVLPFIPGGEMFTHLRKMGKFEETTAQFYAAQVLLALEYLHACDLVYRDLKPENILIDPNGYIKLTDFGFCKILKGRTWTLCGTPEYLAPEIILSKGYGTSVDWWALGVLMYEMSAGFPPFYASDPMMIYEKIVHGKYKVPSHFSSELKHVLSHTLETDISKRYGNLKDGVLDFKNHKWFKSIDWEKLLINRVPAPIVPKVKSPCDTSNFDHYEDQKLKESDKCLFEDEFSDF
ncbi:hypothetical protein JYU34_009615 [Plutella xylostella]|uniref:Uncharacterized protein n=1 Tax=Plutella xylostella TaxID=51655 RepID=A0ABQ7QK11_PLUXY|nr:hypothetical protein JYU34_009615 [Plutella xylostella]